MENYQNTSSNQNEYEKLEVNEKWKENHFQVCKSKPKIHKNVSSVTKK